MKILVTGCAGFIGSHLCDKLLLDGYSVVGIDNLNDYYNPKIKINNLNAANKNKSFKFYKLDILDYLGLKKIFVKEKPDVVIHLAARAGIRASIMDPLLYGKVNKLGTVNLLTISKDLKVKKFIFGSSSSVYGKTKKIPFTENDNCESLISPYGASKRAAEFFVETFSKVYGLKSVVLRFFTVYGPRGRPDMAPALFTKAIFSDQEIVQFGSGSSSRDYTYIEDIVEGIISSIGKDLKFEIINLGNNNPVKLSDFILLIEKLVGKKAKVKKLPQQIGDVESTWANVVKAKKLLNWEPRVRLVDGMKEYIGWLKLQK